MIHLEYTNNPVYIRNLLRIDNLYKQLLDTDSIPDDFLPDTQTTNWFVITKKHLVIGIFAFKFFTNNCIWFHGGLFKPYRGQDTVTTLKTCLNQIPSNYKTTFMTTVKKNNKPAQRLVEMCGFQVKTEIDDTLIYAEF